MSNGRPKKIRLEIAAERQSLDDDLLNLQSETRLNACVRRSRPRGGRTGFLAHGKCKGAETVWKLVK